MALPPITVNQFIGKIKIVSDAYQSTDLNAYIDQCYEDYIRDVIGDKATDEIINTALTQKWLDLFNGVSYFNIQEGRQKKTKGLTYSALRFIYFQYMRDDYDPTPSRNVKPLNEVAVKINSFELAQLLSSKYNDSALSLNCELHPFLNNYSNFKGKINSFIDNGGGSYTILSSNTIYLQEGDTVKILDTEYLISNLIDNVSFDIEDNIGSIFEGDYIYSPYKDVEFSTQDYIVS